ncbi:glycosyltransferase involved in cell wall biosynthesis [Arthrobacter sp. V1I9]|uniref:glycosyltransferase family 4 protein n=1 Tax=Arthrobacter sp. V1I9 TaxID=3042275 RepID=UPI00278EFE39|nr:glycosyltransferase family 4 protein [Arthrobacter sp. V1I9]MDQ0868265.1 glycosyltransferase involved in cell wall biosynthesis [Arthrobacter sp. V1I9]
MKHKVIILGPPPGSPGGIGMMMRHLKSSCEPDSRFLFVDSGTTDHRLRAFVNSALICIAAAFGEGKPLFHLNVASRGSTLRKAILAALITSAGGKYVLHLHGAEYREFYRGSNFLVRTAIRALFRRATRVLVLGQTWRSFVIGTLGVPAHRVGILANAVPGPEELPNRSHSHIRMLFIGRSGARKGLSELMAATASLTANKPWSMILAGDAENDRTRDALNASALVNYTGWIDQAGLAQELGSASIFVLPSHAEGLPLALLDAMAWGLAPIVTDVGSIADVIEDGVNGLFVDVGDAQGLQHAMEQLISDDQLRSRIGNNARRTWQRRFDISQYANRLEGELQIALAEDGPN